AAQTCHHQHSRLQIEVGAVSAVRVGSGVHFRAQAERESQLGSDPPAVLHEREYVLFILLGNAQKLETLEGAGHAKQERFECITGSAIRSRNTGVKSEHTALAEIAAGPIVHDPAVIATKLNLVLAQFLSKNGRQLVKLLK